jgi:hypothetical protein
VTDGKVGLKQKKMAAHSVQPSLSYEDIERMLIAAYEIDL